MTPMKLLALTLCLSQVWISTVRAEEGACVFETDRCSCKFGEPEQGICWDENFSNFGTCTSRYCKAGWTCSCAGRTHLCAVRPSVHNVVEGSFGIGETQPCTQETVQQCQPGDFFKLGFWRPSFSRRGLLANECNQVRWWLNGEEIGDYGVEPTVTAANIDAELERRSNHTRLELRMGDLIAFRIRQGSYHCYNSLSILEVNGTALDSTQVEVTTHFARQFTTDWYKPSFTPTFATDESTAAFSDFLPIRTTLPSTGTAITPGDDVWEPASAGSDHSVSNFYFRMQF